jgi:hypothetical protein
MGLASITAFPSHGSARILTDIFAYQLHKHDLIIAGVEE